MKTDQYHERIADELIRHIEAEQIAAGPVHRLSALDFVTGEGLGEIIARDDNGIAVASITAEPDGAVVRFLGVSTMTPEQLEAIAAVARYDAKPA